MNTKGTILLVEDEPVIGRLTSIRLQKAGYNVVHALDGHSGWEMLRAHRPDLILLDYHLPDMNGTDFGRAIQKDPRTAEIPIILISASPEDESNKRKESGAVGFVAKPYDAPALLALIQKWIEGAPAS